VQRVKLGLGRLARRVAQVAAVLVVLAALGVLGVAWLRSGEKYVPMMPGAALTNELGADSVRTMPGRLVKSASNRLFDAGEGPDQISFLVAGRAMLTDGKAMVFPATDKQHRVGRAIADVVDMEGDIALLKADVLAEGPPLTPALRLQTLLYGPPPDPQVALMLVGTTGRYVALIHEGSGAPLRLEWALGERRGTMLAQASPPGVTHLEMEVDADGMLRAFVGTGKDRRTIGEPLVIGRDWQKHFGEVPRSAVGCIEGTCRVDGFSYGVKQAPATQPTATLAEAAMHRPPPPPPKVQPKAATPVKKPPTKAPPPPKGGKRPR
jgi:hypothetical protein